MHKNNHKLPEIRINFSMRLYLNECQVLEEHYKDRLGRLFSPEHYEQLADAYREAWREYEERILTGMTDALGVSFYRPVIDVALAPFFRPKSTPLIINFRSDPDTFVDVLTHELLHVLQTDNNVHQFAGPKRTIHLMDEWQRLFGEHDKPTLAHILLHALHKHIYLDVLKAPERLERDIASAKKARNGNPYVKAWEYVEQHDYKSMVDDLRRIYS